jgi:hypothetical protein
MKSRVFVGAFLVFGFGIVGSASALLEFPSSLTGEYENNTNPPANTNSIFFQNLLRKINFGNIFSTSNPSIDTQTTSTQSPTTQTGDSSVYSPGSLDTTSYDAEYRKILEQNLGKNGVINLGSKPTTDKNTITPSTLGVTGETVTTAKPLTKDEITQKLEAFILEINKRRAGYAAPANSISTSNTTSSQNGTQNNTNPQQQNELSKVLQQNSMPSEQYGSCNYYTNPSERQSCVNSMKIACQQGFMGGELLLPECAQLPASAYLGLSYGSQPTYSLQNYVNHDPYYRPAASGINVLQEKFPQQYFDKTGNYTGPDRNIIGVATHYACSKRNGQYIPDNYLIATYGYITAFGQKARYGTNVGDSVNACNMNYCGVAVPLIFINATYGSKSAAKDQLIQITNTANLKCTVAPIQDISAIKTFTHTGSNAVIDLSLCVMDRLNGGLANSGNIRVQYKPLKKGERGCGQ